MNSQLSLAVHLPDDETFDSFFAGDNQQLLDQLLGLADQDLTQATYIWGKPGSGRSHLLHACCALLSQKNLATAYLPLRRFDQMSPLVLEGLENVALVCFDDLDAIAGQPIWEEALFDFYNRRLELDSPAPLVISGSAPVNQLGLQLADLESRVNWGLSYKVNELNDAQKVQALQMRADQRGMKLELDVAKYLLKRLSRDMKTLISHLDELDKASIQAQRKLTLPFVKESLSL
ncbi:DnaA inactivator Hda [Alginatibacterium sediminis]|uniref:DnaA inactivator Hda n=1 Tax=Alginatibacterium sediminis TaxID=2164068 RepID=UPI0026CC401A|nr:DnaA inactivator Hda [Alginatibacterium sediminis]